MTLTWLNVWDLRRYYTGAEQQRRDANTFVFLGVMRRTVLAVAAGMSLAAVSSAAIARDCSAMTVRPVTIMMVRMKIIPATAAVMSAPTTIDMKTGTSAPSIAGPMTATGIAIATATSDPKLAPPRVG